MDVNAACQSAPQGAEPSAWHARLAAQSSAPIYRRSVKGLSLPQNAGRPGGLGRRWSTFIRQGKGNLRQATPA